jgi:hypothetical protein
MSKKMFLPLLFLVVCWTIVPAVQICQPSGVWLFNPTAVMDFLFAKNTNVIV